MRAITLTGLLWLALALTAACGEKDEEDGDDIGDTGGDTDTDTDVDADADADGDADTDADGDADSETGVDMPEDCSDAGDGSHSPTVQEVSFVATADGITLHGDLFIPAIGGGPFATVILLHRYCEDRDEWQDPTYDLAMTLAESGFVVLAYDQRGHGASTEGGSYDLCGSTDAAEFAKMVEDVDDAIVFLGTVTEANLDCLGVGGSSIGANVALIHGADTPEVDTVVMLSPGHNYVGLQPVPRIPDFEPRPSLAIATEGDTGGSAETVEDMNAAGEHVYGMIYAGSAHGADIFNETPESFDLVAGWFSDLL